MHKQVSFLSGIQRSGSTLLTKVLNQHPTLFASNTSPLFDYIFFSVEKLTELKNTSSSAHYINIDYILRSTIDSFYHFTDKSHVLDKHRAWASNYTNIHRQLIANPKIIFTLRPVEEVVTSFHTILNKNNTPMSIGQIYKEFLESNIPIMMDAAQFVDQMCVVEYQELTNAPIDTFQRITRFLELPEHTYDFTNIIDLDPENDVQWGIRDLHKVRSSINIQSVNPTTIMTTSELEFFQKLTYRLYKAFKR
jgi:hypothetical protein